MSRPKRVQTQSWHVVRCHQKGLEGDGKDDLRSIRLTLFRRQPSLLPVRKDEVGEVRAEHLDKASFKTRGGGGENLEHAECLGAVFRGVFQSYQ